MTAESYVRCTELELDNGLRVILAEDHAMPVVTLAIRYDAGSRREGAGHSGQAHLLEHLMFQGSSRVAAGEHVRALEAMGGRAGARTSLDSTYYSQTIPSDGLQLALWLEGERMSTVLDAAGRDSLHVQRKVVLNERHEVMDNVPYGTAEELILARLFPEGHPYHHHPLGSRRGLEAVSWEDVMGFFERFYKPDNAIVGVVGDFSIATVVEWVIEYLGWISNKSEASCPPEPPISQVHVERLEIDGRIPPKIFLGYRIAPAGTREFDAARVASLMLGHGRGAPMWRRLAHDRDLVTDLRFRLTPLVGGASLGIAEITPRLGVAPTVVEQAYQAEVLAFATRGPAETDMRWAMAQLESAWLSRLETTGGRAEELTWHALFAGTGAHTGRVLPRLREVTAAEVQRCVGEWADGAGRAVVTYRTAPC